MRAIIAAAALASAACAPVLTAAPPPPVTPLDHLPALKGDYFAIDSRQAGHRYHVYIRYPEGYAERPDARFPVLYVLDGDSLFPHLASNQIFLHYDDRIPDSIVVGIAYGSFDSPQNRRRHDFTAGAAAFDRFLERELIPKIEARTRSDPARRILLGQSRGGGYVLHSAFRNPDLFWARIASNPSVDLLPSLRSAPSPASRRDLRLMIASGSLEDAKYRGPRKAWVAGLKVRPGLPWKLKVETVEGGTHAADSARVHRSAMRWLFGDGGSP